ncbi:MAG: vanadium-dependent haloperoxidase [Acidobacteriota bacterium]|nr:vanadium-dependent haloperoxidase [Acidobacteriota bacterium]MDQ3421082.1 vanadium-dependent haloperoxidase [Acidobacteriota bacterium]
MNRTLLLACATNLLFCVGVARADVVRDWNAVMQTTVAGQNPFAQARFAAITQLAVFEAVNTITGDYEPYLGTIEAPGGASAEAAAIAAAYRVLKTYFPANAALDTARANSLAAISESQAKADGIAVGEAAAAGMIALRSADGSAPPQFYAPSSSAAGEWQRTAGCPPAGGILLHWRNVAPFGIESSSQFRSEPPPALTSNEYVKDYREVMEVGDSASVMRPADRADGARFYAAVLAVATWNPAVRQVAEAEGTSLSENARAFALLNVAISDALVSVMETKYHYTFWRPETAIPGFVPFIGTPCFPGYPSAHASASYAAEEIARRIFGAGGHSIVLTSPPAVGVTLTYKSFKEIARDIDDARVYGGIHFRFDQEAGAVQGRDIGKYVYKNMLRPVQQ